MAIKKSDLTEAELLQRLARGEDSRQQFKRDATNADSLASELAALANSGGGQLLLGVADDGSVVGLDAAAVRRLNQLVSNAASQHVRPPLSPTSQNIQTTQGLVIVVAVPDGLNKPYLDAQGCMWVKNGADKRHVTSREEMQRMFQRAGLLQADQVPVRGATMRDIDERAFGRYFERQYGQTLEQAGLHPAVPRAGDGCAEGAGRLAKNRPRRRAGGKPVQSGGVAGTDPASHPRCDPSSHRGRRPHPRSHPRSRAAAGSAAR